MNLIATLFFYGGSTDTHHSGENKTEDHTISAIRTRSRAPKFAGKTDRRVIAAVVRPVSGERANDINYHTGWIS